LLTIALGAEAVTAVVAQVEHADVDPDVGPFLNDLIGGSDAPAQVIPGLDTRPTSQRLSSSGEFGAERHRLRAPSQ